MPGSLALISAAFPEAERGRAIGTWSGFSGITAAVGPVFGGFLVDHYSWAWAFLINLPLAVAVIVISWKHVPESREHSHRGPVDLAGATSATVALGGLVYALIEAPVRGWTSPQVLAGARSALSPRSPSCSPNAAAPRRCCRSACSRAATSAAPTC
jgi:MFS family permease